MTRINVVPVHELCNQHLFAEWREMPRLVGNLNKSLNRAKPFDPMEIPPEYVLGKGHVKFFYNKFKWLYKRHQNITLELLERGYNVSKGSEVFLSVDPQWLGDWEPSEKDLELNRERIRDRMPKNPKWGKVNV